MIIEEMHYFIAIGIIAILISIIPLYTRFAKRQGNKRDYTFLLILLLIPINWFIPRILTVYNCSDYTIEVALFPTNLEGKSIGYANKKTYIVNKGAYPLAYENIVYGEATLKENQKDSVIPAGKIEEVPVIFIDYILQVPSASVSGKSSGEIKTALFCTDNNEE